MQNYIISNPLISITQHVSSLCSSYFARVGLASCSLGHYLSRYISSIHLLLMFHLQQCHQFLVSNLYMKAMGPVDMKKKYNAKWAVVTGAGTGIGKSLAETMAQQGLNVVLVSLPDKFLDETTEELKKRFPNLEFRKVAAKFDHKSDYMTPIIEVSPSLCATHFLTTIFRAPRISTFRLSSTTLDTLSLVSLIKPPSMLNLPIWSATVHPVSASLTISLSLCWRRTSRDASSSLHLSLVTSLTLLLLCTVLPRLSFPNSLLLLRSKCATMELMSSLFILPQLLPTSLIRLTN